MKVGQRFLHLFLDSVGVILTSVQDMRRAEVSSVIPCEEQLVGNGYRWVSCSVVYFHFGEMRYCWWSFWSVEWVGVSPGWKGLLVAGWVLQELQTIGVVWSVVVGKVLADGDDGDSLLWFDIAERVCDIYVIALILKKITRLANCTAHMWYGQRNL